MVHTPHQEDFNARLEEMFQGARTLGFYSVTIRAGDLHDSVAGNLGTDHRMPACCSAMREAMGPDDKILHEPPKGNGRNVIIEYRIPR